MDERPGIEMTPPPGIDADLFRTRCLGNAALMADLLALFATHAPARNGSVESRRGRRRWRCRPGVGPQAQSAAGTVAAMALHGLLVECEADPTPDRAAAVEEELRRCLG